MRYSTSKPTGSGQRYGRSLVLIVSQRLLGAFAHSCLYAQRIRGFLVRTRDHTQLPFTLLSSLLRGRELRQRQTDKLSSKPPQDAKKPILNALKQLTPHENIYTIPNILTFSRLIAAPVIGYLVLHDYHAWAVGLFAYAGITDLIDGWIARRWKLQTVVGTVIDPMADKTLMTILTVCLAIKGALPGNIFLFLPNHLNLLQESQPSNAVIVWLAGIILGRDVGLGIAAIYYRWISLPPPKTFARYWDFSLPSAEVHPTTISKYNTALQLALIGATTAMPLVTVDITTAMTAMQ